ncbi:MAG TPA: diaminopimelate decarboxylase [Cytophagaceae bacterium]|jgi:diaminopimelate decarboxylase|nr:diaminopimelate decarboxylase [Cytophagaceae bacterium]
MQLVNNQYQIQGVNVLEICAEYGTPLYVYDANKIISQYENFKKAFEGVNIKIKYATKALTNQAILKVLRKAGAGADAVSVQEIKLSLMAGFSPGNIMFTPNCTDFEEIREAVLMGVTVNIDNIPFLEVFGKEYGNSYPVCIRINPHIDAGGNKKIMTGHKRSKFGISIDQMSQVYALVNLYNIKVCGVHVHSGSDFKNSEAFVQAAEVVFQVAAQFNTLEFLDFGSGFKVAYKEGDHVTDLMDLGVKMKQVFRDFCKRYGKELELWFEPGKYLVSESGFLFAKVNVVKETPICTFVGVNTGLNHLIRPMMYDAYHSIFNVSNTSGPKRMYDVVGYICETDTFATDMEMDETKEGNIIGIRNAGAYGFSMSSNYNSRFRPAEVMILEGKAMLIRQRETMEDLLRNQIEVNF